MHSYSSESVRLADSPENCIFLKSAFYWYLLSCYLAKRAETPGSCLQLFLGLQLADLTAGRSDSWSFESFFELLSYLAYLAA